MQTNDYLIGISYYDKELIFLFGYKYVSIYLIPKNKRKTFGLYKVKKPNLEQCLYALDPQRHKLKNFFGFRKINQGT